MNTMIIYVEGNIGSGKTTFINLLQDYLSKFDVLNKNAKLVLEPVDEWLKTEDSDGENILQKFYGDQEKWSFAFQMNSFISRVKKIQDEFHNGDDKPLYNDVPKESQLITNYNVMEKLVFVERSIYTDYHCFAKLCYENGKMTKLEYDIYCKWNDWLSEQFNVKPDAYIYLRSDPTINDERIKERSRMGEDGIPLDYLKALHEKHDEWLNFEKEHVPVYVVDSTQNFKKKEVMDTIFEGIFEFVKTF